MMLNKDRGELTEQLNATTRQKTALAEELIATRKEIERQSDTIVRIAKEKEELTREVVRPKAKQPGSGDLCGNITEFGVA